MSISGASGTGNVVEGNAINANAVGVVISAQASSNTVGGIVAGTPNTIGSNTTNGITILSGTGNAVRENLYQGTNGTISTPSVAASDIVVAPNANGNIAAPVLYSAAQDQTSTGYTLSVLFTGVLPASSNGQPITVDVYKYTSTARTFLGTADWDGTAPESVTIDLQAPLVAGTDQIVATATVAGDGTSSFSAPFTVTSAGTVSNTQDSGPGSLRFELAEATPGTQIEFSIPASDPNYSAATGNFTIHLLSPLTISTQVFIDGTTEAINEDIPGAVIQITDGTASDGGSPTLPYGIDLAAGSNGSTIKGLEIVGFTAPGGAGILIESNDNTVVDNWIGTDPAGNNLGNDEGVVIDGTGSGNTIGGSVAGTGNTIGFNADAGVSISGIDGHRQPGGGERHRDQRRRHQPGQRRGRGPLRRPGEHHRRHDARGRQYHRVQHERRGVDLGLDRRPGLGQLDRHRRVQRQDGQRRRDRDRRFLGDFHRRHRRRQYRSHPGIPGLVHRVAHLLGDRRAWGLDLRHRRHPVRASAISSISTRRPGSRSEGVPASEASPVPPPPTTW